jgi:glycine/D-amino acid oxidase-like deaminating enzyme/nitrite reductase/ring-hydroxylating ferredoxin subunit
MGQLARENTSVWVETTPETAYPTLQESLTVDVCVIGAGITGLSTAHALKRAGATVALIDAGHICSGVTAYTTAKVTALHGLVYDTLAGGFGDEGARTYAEANTAGIAEIASVAQNLDIDCEIQRLPALTWTEDPSMVQTVEKEVAAARAAGLPATLVTDAHDLPFGITAAIRVDAQLQFHPRKYCLGIARELPGDGCHIFEHTQATDVTQGEAGCSVQTPEGEIHAGHVIIATQIPFLDRGGFFAKTHPERSYAMAVTVAGEVPQGMWYRTDQPSMSVRPRGENQLIVAGSGHKTGQPRDESHADEREHYRTVEEWVRSNWEVVSIDARWSAQDYMPVDGVPYIGRLPRGSERLLVATGFKKWGLAHGAAAALILTELVQGRDHQWLSLYDATRADVLHSAKEFTKENLNVAKRFFGDRLKDLVAPPPESLSRGEGGIVSVDGDRVAAYRDDEGELHMLSPICTHMGCHVAFNTAEKTWDCPCHGSRFDTEGQIIQGPALKPLDRKR